MNKKITHLHKLVIALAGTVLLSTAFAQTPYPAKRINLIVGFSAGSSIDLVARVVANKLSDKLGQAIVVENKPGAGGNIAAEHVAHSAADGYTLLVVANSIAISPALYKNLGFDPTKDLTAISYIGIGPVILKVNSKTGFNNLGELITYAKAHPAKLNYGSSGVGGTPHMATVLFEQITGTKMTHIPYKGGGDALAALLGGQVDVLINPLLGNVESDKVKSLAITGDKRSPLAPSVPTFGELGYPKYDVGVYYGIMGPAGMPSDIVNKLNNEVSAVLADPEVVESLTGKNGIVLKAETADEFQTFLDNDMERWKKVVEAGHVSVE
ncbi:tripartite tricarboxylate transporter substrate binding protein [Allopusillimonas soli]|uniref:Tripartite tricarboxylate transporter substrate binding protein n=1 Tax=Allopusillimonas soli TaxID=659016 RepID=A0A853FAI3_9BURK|nr:tripartite tricarboxylate transporter substrate binding protein [Allopusillimonas soli]NYT35571.1 tripartite tricarboxylate transporter substrate binding protein [Allopusillimonas soli]TEA75974.1 tripartite tricarboxylate transporter substrate binding protein [Allopusillimonas soli]